jgi:glycosyltransferase involved in cell wall biosynthesis
MSITIGIDAINIRSGGGVTHLTELIKNYLINKDHDIGEIIIWATQGTLNQLPTNQSIIKINSPFFEKSTLHRIYFQLFKLSKAAKKSHCDVLFIPGGSYFGSFKPFVTMSQNLLPFEMNEIKRYNFAYFCKLLLLRLSQSITFKNSNGIIFLTNYAKETVIKVVGNIDSKIVIIPHGISNKFLNQPKNDLSNNSYTTEKPFRILYVSIIDMYKHQWNVIQAIHKLRMDGYKIVIDLVGPSFPPALKKLKKHISILDPSELWVNYSGPIKYEYIEKFYLKADLGLFASTCENMPIILLEKMASGLPIACSNRGPMPEILGNAGLYFDPENIDQISDVIKKYYLSNELRNHSAKLSFAISKEFNWIDTSYKTFQFLKSFSKSRNVNRI